MILKLIRYLRGSVKFRAKGGNTYRFFNICAHNNIAIWNSYRDGDLLYGNTSIHSYRKIPYYVRKTGVRLKVIERFGLPFLIYRYRKRIGIVGGILLAMLFIGVMSCFIWTIKIEGNVTIPTQTIIQELKASGVGLGTLKFGVNVDKVAAEVLLKIDKLSWSSLYIGGTTAIFKVKERTLPPEKIDLLTPQNIVAAESGQIKYLEVYDGVSLVAVGDTVLKGDVLVSGIASDQWGKTHLKYSRAKIIAQYSASIQTEVPLTQTIYTYSGKIVSKNFINIFGLKLPLFVYQKIPEPYKLEKTTEQFTAFGFVIPIEFVSHKYILLKEQPLILTIDEAFDIAKKQQAREEFRRFKDGKIIEAVPYAKNEQNTLVLTTKYKVESNIAKEQPIATDPQNNIFARYGKKTR